MLANFTDVAVFGFAVCVAIHPGRFRSTDVPRFWQMSEIDGERHGSRLRTMRGQTSALFGHFIYLIQN